MNPIYNGSQSLGCLLELPDDRDFDYGNIAGGGIELPANFVVDVPWHFYQNGIDSCVGSATAAAKSVQEGRQVSPRYIWSKCKERQGYQGWGTYVTYALKSLVDSGVCQYGVIDENVVGVDRNEYMRYESTDKIEQNASKHKAESYWRPRGWDMIDQALYEQKTPLITSMLWFDVYNKPDKNGIIYPGGVPKYGHCFIYLGWKHIKEKKVRVFKNSWKETWGDKGNFYILDEDKDKFKLGGFYVIVDMPVEKAKIINEYQGKLIRNYNSPKHYFVGKDKIAWIKNEESFTFGRDNGFWGDWKDVQVIEEEIKHDLIF